MGEQRPSGSGAGDPGEFRADDSLAVGDTADAQCVSDGASESFAGSSVKGDDPHPGAGCDSDSDAPDEAEAGGEAAAGSTEVLTADEHGQSGELRRGGGFESGALGGNESADRRAGEHRRRRFRLAVSLVRGEDYEAGQPKLVHVPNRREHARRQPGERDVHHRARWAPDEYSSDGYKRVTDPEPDRGGSSAAR